MMAYQNYKEREYIDLVTERVYKSYCVAVEERYIKQSNRIMSDFYAMLRDYWLKLLFDEQMDVVGVTAYKCTVPASLFVLKLTRGKKSHINGRRDLQRDPCAGLSQFSGVVGCHRRLPG